MTQTPALSFAFPLSFFQGFFLPLLAFILFAPFSADVDIASSAFFYKEGHFSNQPFWDWIYLYALFPGWLLAILAFLGGLLSLMKQFKAWRKPCLYLLLCLAIGSGLIIHALFKEHWGRPRPRQVEQFGGHLLFRPYFSPHFTLKREPAKSFASGHASLGFYFFSLAFLAAIYQKRALYRMSMGLALILGCLLSVARVAQGGHFLSDTLASALVMWLTAWALAYLLFRRKPTCVEVNEKPHT